MPRRARSDRLLYPPRRSAGFLGQAAAAGCAGGRVPWVAMAGSQARLVVMTACRCRRIAAAMTVWAWVGHDYHLFLIGQVDPDDRVHRRHQLAEPRQPRIAVAVPPGHAATVAHERPPPAMGHQARNASGGRSYARHRHAERLAMPHCARDARLCRGARGARTRGATALVGRHSWTP
jgi:hypothetical protein